MNKDKIEQFSDYLYLEKRYSQHTVRAYYLDLNQFDAFFNKPFEELVLFDVRLFLADAAKRKLKPSSVHRKIASLRSFFAYGIRRAWWKSSPLAYLSLPSKPKRLPRALGIQDVFQTFEALDYENIDFEHNLKESQAKLIFELFYATGMRCAELATLQIRHVHSDYIHVEQGKGGKSRIIPLYAGIAERMKKFLQWRTKHASYHQFIWVFSIHPVSTRWVYALISNILKQSGANKTNPHAIRHSFATHLLNQGANLNAVSKLLGHSSLASTQIYTSNSIENLKKIHKQAHPKSE